MKGFFFRNRFGKFSPFEWTIICVCIFISENWRLIWDLYPIILIQKAFGNINPVTFCQKSPHTHKKTDNLVLFWIIRNSKILLLVQQATIFERIQNWFKLFMLRAIYGQESNSGIGKLLFSAITFDLIKSCSGIWGRTVNKTCFFEDGNSGTHLK